MKRLLLVITAMLAAQGAQAQGYARHNTTFVTATPVVSASPDYTAADCIGGVMTFSAPALFSAPKGMVGSAILTDLAGQAIEADLVLFDSNPSAGTYTDNASCDIHDTDLPKVIGVVSFGSTDDFTFADNGVNYKGNLGVLFEVVGAATDSDVKIYGILVARSTPNLATTSDITVTLGISVD